MLSIHHKKKIKSKGKVRGAKAFCDGTIYGCHRGMNKLKKRTECKERMRAKKELPD
jgi:hypothetical protein